MNDAQPTPTYPGPASDSIRLAKEWMRPLLHEGVICPACTQRAQIYTRAIYAQMARALIRLYRVVGMEFGHWPTIMGRKQADEAKLVHWGLIEPDLGEREDGSSRTGWWRVTELGRTWLLGNVAVPKYVDIYDSRPLRVHGEDWTVRDALGKHFDYEELMRG